MTEHFEPQPCPTCNNVLGIAPHAEFVVCLGCGIISRVTPTGLRVATAEELEPLSADQLATFLLRPVDSDA